MRNKKANEISKCLVNPVYFRDLQIPRLLPLTRDPLGMTGFTNTSVRPKRQIYVTLSGVEG